MTTFLVFVFFVSFTPPKKVSIIFALDNSPSVYKKYDPNNQRKDALYRAIESLKKLPIDVNFSYISFGDPARIIIPMKPVSKIGPELLQKDQNFFDSYTNFNDLFAKAIRELHREAESAMKMIILVSDGEPWPKYLKSKETSSSNFNFSRYLERIRQEYLKILQKNNILLYMFFLGKGRGSTEKFWRDFSKSTGGDFFKFTSPEDIELLIEKLFTSISGLNQVSFIDKFSSSFEVPPFLDYVIFRVSGYNCKDKLLVKIRSPRKVEIIDTIKKGCFKIYMKKRPVKGKWYFELATPTKKENMRIIFNVTYGPSYLHPKLLTPIPDYIKTENKISKINFVVDDTINHKRLVFDSLKLYLISLHNDTLKYLTKLRKDSVYEASLISENIKPDIYRISLEIDDPTYDLKKMMYLPFLKCKKCKFEEKRDSLYIIGYLDRAYSGHVKFKIDGELAVEDTTIKLSFNRQGKRIYTVVPNNIINERFPRYLVLRIYTRYFLPDTTVVYTQEYVHEFRTSFTGLFKNILLILLIVALSAVIITNRLHLAKLMSILAVIFLKLSRDKFFSKMFIKKALTYGFKKTTDLIAYTRGELKDILSTYISILDRLGENYNLYEIRYWASGNEVFRQAVGLKFAKDWNSNPLKFFSTVHMIYQHYPHDIFLYSAFYPLTELQFLYSASQKFFGKGKPEVKSLVSGIDPEMPESAEYESLYDIAIRISKLYNPLTYENLGCKWLISVFKNYVSGDIDKERFRSGDIGYIWYDDVTDIYLLNAKPQNIIALIYYFISECKSVFNYESLKILLQAYRKSLDSLIETLGFNPYDKNFPERCKDIFSTTCARRSLADCLIYLNEIRVNEKISCSKYLNSIGSGMAEYTKKLLEYPDRAGVLMRFFKVFGNVDGKLPEGIDAEKLDEWIKELLAQPLPETNVLVSIFRRWKEWRTNR